MYAQIALPLPVRRLFIYLVPSDLQGKIALGCRVLVPLERRFISGFVVELIPQTKIKGVKEIIDLLDPEPLFSEEMLSLTQYVSRYYFCSWGETLKAALPAEFQAERFLWVKKKEFDQKVIPDLSKRQAEILNLLEKKSPMKIVSIKRELSHKGIESDLYHLKEKEIVEFFHKSPQPRLGIEYEKIIRIKDPILCQDELQRLKQKAPRQQECLQILLEKKGELSLDILKKTFKPATRIVKELEKKGLVKIVQKKRAKEEIESLKTLIYSDADLNSVHLKDTLQKIKKAIQGKRHNVFLLYGVNHRDRLKIYIEVIREVLKYQRQASILAPEILLANQLSSYFKSYFGNIIGRLHSRLSSSERLDTWTRIKRGELPVVVGTRSAVFSPLNNLGLIILDEEHDLSYKQEDSDPRYHARDVAVKRGETEDAVVILGSATPSLESYHSARKGKYLLCRLEQGAKKKSSAQVKIVDMHQERKEGNFSPFSKRLTHLLKDKISRKEKVILFLNRRGFSRVVGCQDCGFVFKCPNCDIPLAFHQTDYPLRCHFCNFKTKVGPTCPECGGFSFSYAGTGIQKIDEEIKGEFPSATILRMDLDTASSRNSYSRILDSFKSKDFNILLGTRMIAKDWDFPDVSLVGVISADFCSYFPDFRSKEKTFQLLNQVVNIAKEKGEVVIQTYHPEEWSKNLFSLEGFLRFYELELANREDLNYPPFSNLILVRFSGRDKKSVSKYSRGFASRLKRRLEKEKTADILGPAPAPLSRIRGRYRYQILIKTKKVVETTESIALITQMKSLKKSPSLRITINVDPVEMM